MKIGSETLSQEQHRNNRVFSDIVLWRETTSSACRKVKGCLLGTTLEALSSRDHSTCEKALLFAHKKEHLMALQKLAYFNS